MTQRSKPSWYVTLFSAAVFVAITGAITLPANQKRAAILQDIEQKQSILARLDRSAPAAEALRMQRLSRAVAAFESQLLPPGEMDKFIEELWRAAEANSLQTRSIKADGETKIGTYPARSITLCLTGNFSAFYQFLLNLETAHPAMKVEKLRLTPIAPERPGEIQADLTITLLLKSPMQAPTVAVANAAMKER